MPFNAGWRDVKTMTNEENLDLTGAIKNGLERGESLEDIRMSLFNAGYKIEKVNNTIQTNMSLFHRVKPPQQFSEEISNKPKKSFKFKVILIVIIALLLTAGVLIFLFRDFLIKLIR